MYYTLMPSRPACGRLTHLALAVLASVAVGCGGGGGGPDDPVGMAPPPPAPPAAPPSPQPPPTGGGRLGLDLTPGTTWEYGWNSLSAVGVPGQTSVSGEAGRFRVTLGDPVTIAGRTGLRVQLTGLAPDGLQLQALAAQDEVLYASTDGNGWRPLYAAAGRWQGGGLFLPLPPDIEVAVEPATIDNDYLTAPALAVGVTDASPLCDSIAGRQFCDGASTYREFEYYDNALGFVGYLYQYDTVDPGFGGAISNTRFDVGLIATTLRGDPLAYDLEVEPNNAPDVNAMVLAAGRPVVGQRQREQDFGGSVDVAIYEPEGGFADVEPNELPSQAVRVSMFEPVYGRLSADGATATLAVTGLDGAAGQLVVQDLYRLDFSALPPPARSGKPHGDCPAANVRAAQPSSGTLQVTLLERQGESLRVLATGPEAGRDALAPTPTLVAGTDYLLAVDGDGTPASEPYVITMACAPPAAVPVAQVRTVQAFDWYAVTLTAPGRLAVTAQGADFVLVDAAPFALAVSAPVAGEPGRSEVAVELPAGDYLIGVTSSAGSGYTITAFY